MLKRILIIDDDENFTQVLSRSLERQQYTTAVANNCADALSQSATFKPDWIILDLRLEHESGLTLIPSLVKHNPSCRIVVLTGYASIPTAVEAIKLGAHNYLHKPVNLQDLIAAFADDADSKNTDENSSSESEVMSMQRLEWEHIQRVLAENEGNISATARALNMHRRTLQRKLQKHAPR